MLFHIHLNAVEHLSMLEVYFIIGPFLRQRFATRLSHKRKVK